MDPARPPLPPVAELRRSYGRAGLEEADVDVDPTVQVRAWLAEAVADGVLDPNAMVLATADADGRPSSRTVLLKAVDERGFAFYTNLGSRKARELAANPHAALTFTWLRLERQVCVTGAVQRLPDEEADAYFATRPRGSQLGAWASPQSAVVTGRAELDARYAQVEARFAGAPVPRPPGWGGFVVVPTAVELWQGRPDRMHDRLRYRRATTGWVLERLAP